MEIPVQPSVTKKIKREAPKQEMIKEQINALKSQIVSMRGLQNSGLNTSISQKDVINATKELHEKEKTLKKMVLSAEWQRKNRIKLKKTLTELGQTNDKSATALKTFTRVKEGRPSIEEDQSQLLSTILDIVNVYSAAEDKRRCEILWTVKTLDDLHAEVLSRGFTISRSPLYYRLLPRRENSIDGKRHHKTVPVRLLRPENTLRKKNIDRMFAKSFIDDMRNLDPLFGDDAMVYLSIDDKAKVALGLAAAKLQSPILMHVEYKVNLPRYFNLEIF